ncbi:MAG: acyl-CoA dehydrogenase [Chitinophagaceae bacterium]
MKHPHLGLSSEMIDILRSDSHEAEKHGRLSPGQLKLIHDQKWFHLFVSKEYGGLALSLPEAVRLEESIAYADGSVGWVVTLCAGAGMFIGYFDEDLAKEIFSDPYVCLAGSGQANGTATIIDGGFEINGYWPYASGAPHATHFTANCIIDGSQHIQSFIFKKEEVTLHPNWKYIGLNATAGYSYSVKDLKIPANRTFIIDPEHTRLPHPVYRYPFLQLAETTIAANISGMCLYFFDLAKDFLTKKPNTNTRTEAVTNKGLELITSGNAEMELLQRKFYTALDASWSSHVANNKIMPTQLKAVTRTSLHLAQQSRNLVNRLYPYCGLHAARTDSVINQVWRNINTASQHSLLLETI